MMKVSKCILYIWMMSILYATNYKENDIRRKAPQSDVWRNAKNTKKKKKILFKKSLWKRPELWQGKFFILLRRFEKIDLFYKPFLFLSNAHSHMYTTLMGYWNILFFSDFNKWKNQPTIISAIFLSVISCKQYCLSQITNFSPHKHPPS